MPTEHTYPLSGSRNPHLYHEGGEISDSRVHALLWQCSEHVTFNSLVKRKFQHQGQSSAALAAAWTGMQSCFNLSIQVPVPKFQKNYVINLIRGCRSLLPIAGRWIDWCEIVDRQSTGVNHKEIYEPRVFPHSFTLSLPPLIHSLISGGAFPVICGCQGLQEGIPRWNGKWTELETSVAPGLLW